MKPKNYNFYKHLYSNVHRIPIAKVTQAQYDETKKVMHENMYGTGDAIAPLFNAARELKS